MDRRQCLATLAAVIAPMSAPAQERYPSRLIKVIVGFPPGTSTDVATRVIAEALAKRLGQPVVTENRPGASSTIAARAVASAEPDGYTIFVGTVANAINTAFATPNAPDLTQDFAPVAMIGSVANVLVVNPSLAVATVPELIAAAKAKPGVITFASAGHGTSPHLSGELFASRAGIKLVHVPYRGSAQAVTDLLGGQVQMMFSPASSVLPHIASGALKALATTSAKRTELTPDLPTLQELGFADFESSVWFGLLLPKSAPADIVNRLSDEIRRLLDLPEVQTQFRTQGIDIIRSTPDGFAQYIRGETNKWAELIRTVGLTAQ